MCERFKEKISRVSFELAGGLRNYVEAINKYENNSFVKRDFV